MSVKLETLVKSLKDCNIHTVKLSSDSDFGIEFQKFIGDSFEEGSIIYGEVYKEGNNYTEKAIQYLGIVFILH